MKKITCAVLLILGIGILDGCRRSGETLQPVAGKVVFKGKPLVTGLIRFSNPQIGIDMCAKINSDGTYQVQRAKGLGLPEGTYKAAVLPPIPNIPIGGFVQNTPPPKQEPFPNIPAKYHDPASSGLTMTVAPGDNNYDVDLQ